MNTLDYSVSWSCCGQSKYDSNQPYCHCFTINYIVHWFFEFDDSTEGNNTLIFLSKYLIRHNLSLSFIISFNNVYDIVYLMGNQITS